MMSKNNIKTNSVPLSGVTVLALVFIPLTVYTTAKVTGSSTTVLNVYTQTCDKTTTQIVSLNNKAFEDHITQTTPLIESVEVDYNKLSLDVFRKAKLSSQEQFKLKVYEIESGHSYTAVNKYGNCFGACQLNNYWGTELLKRAKKNRLVEDNTTWTKQKTKPAIQDVLCQLRFRDVDRASKRIGYHNDLVKYLLHQQGIAGGEKILLYVRGILKDLPDEIKTNLIANISESDQNDFAAAMENGELDTAYLIYKWVRLYKSKF
jgi:hypothetical protein